MQAYHMGMGSEGLNRDENFSHGLSARHSMSSLRVFFLTTAVVSVVLIGLSLGAAGIRLYRDMISDDKNQERTKRTAQWKQTPEQVLAEMYASAVSPTRSQ